VRAHSKLLTLASAKLSALHHDFHIYSAVQSVMFTGVDIPENRMDSFYKGSVDVTVKYKVFTPSSAMRHIAESIFSDIPVMDFLQTNQYCSCTQMKGQITDVHTGLCNYLTFACLSDLTLI